MEMHLHGTLSAVSLRSEGCDTRLVRLTLQRPTAWDITQLRLRGPLDATNTRTKGILIKALHCRNVVELTDTRAHVFSLV